MQPIFRRLWSSTTDFLSHSLVFISRGKYSWHRSTSRDSLFYLLFKFSKNFSRAFQLKKAKFSGNSQRLFTPSAFIKLSSRRLVKVLLRRCFRVKTTCECRHIAARDPTASPLTLINLLMAVFVSRKHSSLMFSIARITSCSEQPTVVRRSISHSRANQKFMILFFFGFFVYAKNKISHVAHEAFLLFRFLLDANLIE